MSDLSNARSRKPLLPPEVIAKITDRLNNANEADPVALVKFDLPSQLGPVWSWYLVDYNGEDECFGLVAGHEVEAGYFYLSELEGLYEELKQSGTLAAFARDGNTLRPVERDAQFKPARLSELRRYLQTRRAMAHEP